MTTRKSSEGSTKGAPSRLPVTSAPSINMKTRSETSRNFSYRSAKSQGIRIKEVDYELNVEIGNLDREEQSIINKRIDLQSDIDFLYEKVKEIQNAVGNEMNEDRVRLQEQELVSTQVALKEASHKMKKLCRDADLEIKSINWKRKLLQDKTNLEKDKIAEEFEQYLSDEEERDGQPIITDKDPQVRDDMDLYLEDASRKAAECQQMKENETLEAERMLLLKTLSNKKLATEIAISKAKEEAKLQQDTIKRNTDEQAVIEEQINSINKAEVVSTQEDAALSEIQAVNIVPGMEQLVDILAKAMGKVNTPIVHQDNNTRFLARQSHAKDLPFFNGNPEEWLTFSNAYSRTTNICGFTDDENLNRLQKCLKGEAFKSVQTLMTTPQNVTSIMKILTMRFGQPEFIIKAMTQKVRILPPMKEEKLETIIELGVAVAGLIRTLQALDCKNHLTNPMLLEELEGKLTAGYRMNWREWLVTNPNKLKDAVSFSEWLEMKTNIACALCPPKAPSTSTDDRRQDQGRFRNRRHGEHAMVANETQNRGLQNQEVRSDVHERKEIKCLYCSKTGHKLQKCRSFESADIATRNKHAKEKRLCFGCLNYGHRTSECRSKRACGKDGCTMNHHFLLHFPPRLKLTKETESVNLINEVEDCEQTCAFTESKRDLNSSQVKMWILPVKVKGPKGTFSNHVILDSASSVSMIHSSLAKQLGLDGEEKVMNLTGINQTTPVKYMSVDLTLLTADGKRKFPIRGLRTVDHLPLPGKSISYEQVQKWNHLRGLDIPYFQGQPPQILLGQDHAALMTPIERKVGPAEAPIAIKTELGWTLGGNSGDLHGGDYTFFTHELDESLHKMVKDSFATENMGVVINHEKPRSQEDKLAQALLDKTLIQTDHEVECGLLWKDSDTTPIPDGYSNAFKRLKSMEKKMDLNPEFANEYKQKIEEYLEKGYAKVLTDDEVKDGGERVYYIPHFMHYNPKKPNKSRFVFDCASKVNGISINDRLMKGPDKLRPLPSVLHRFRQKRIALTGDIQDMFHRVKVRKEDVSAQRFLWRGMDRDRAPDVLQMGVLIFGITCSPVCAIEALNKNAQRFKTKYPGSVTAIQECTYMDDYGDSLDSEDEAITRRMEIQEIHEAGGSHIHKWATNSLKVLNTIPEDLRAAGMIQ